MSLRIQTVLTRSTTPLSILELPFFWGNTLKPTIPGSSSGFFYKNCSTSRLTTDKTIGIVKRSKSSGILRNKLIDACNDVSKRQSVLKNRNNNETKDTLMSSFWPFMQRKSSSLSPPLQQATRKMATHRDTGFGGNDYRGHGSGYQGNSNFNRYKRIFQSFQAPLVFTAAVLVGNYLLMPLVFKIPVGGTYFRRHPDHLVYGLIGVNIAGFLAWKSPITSRFMYRYGLLHKDAQFNVWSMVGSAFSHQEIWHLGLNMFALYQFGIPVARMMGSEKFLEAYLDSAVIASLGSLMFPVLVGVSNTLPSLGASGAVFSMFGIFSYIVPGLRVFLFFVPIPLNAWYVFLGSIGYSAFRVVSRKGILDHAGHLGGCLAGLGWGYYVDQKRKEQQRRRSSSWSYRF